jgi:hypothetical protein
MSVKEMTPVSRPEIPVVPDTAGNAAFNPGDGAGELYGATRTADDDAGVGGPE